MKVDKLIMVNWGSLQPGEYSMNDMTLLTGPTGSGKSTLLDALQTIMTAAYQNLYTYNSGQGETSQSARDGKTKRTIWSYFLGGEDNLFARPNGAHGYIAAVFRPSEGEDGNPFTALIGAAARVDGSGDRRQAIQERLVLLLIDEEAIELDALVTVADGDYQVVPVDKIESHLRSRYRHVFSCNDSKREYLCQLYGRFRGKRTVSFTEAELAAKAWSQSIAYKPIGSVDELVKTQILEHDPNLINQRIAQISDLMRQIHGLHREGERLSANVARLEKMDSRIAKAMESHEKDLVYRLLAAKRSHDDDQQRIDEAERVSAEYRQKIHDERLRIQNLETREKACRTGLIQIGAKLLGIPAHGEKNSLEEKIAAARNSANGAIEQLKSSLIIGDTLVARAKHIAGMKFMSPDLDKAASRVAEAMHLPAQLPFGVLRSKLEALDVNGTRALKSCASEIKALDGKADALFDSLAGSKGFIHALREYQFGLKREEGDVTGKEKGLAERKKAIAGGGTDYPNEIRYALQMLRGDFPTMRVQVLCDLIEPVSAEWQPAIEALMARARFNLIVDEKDEKMAIEYVKRRNLRAKVIQGHLCLQNAKPHLVPGDSIIHELKSDHPVARAYLVEQYGQVVKVPDVDTLRNTPRGLMLDGMASGSRTMFHCDPVDLVFGKEAKRRALERIISEHQNIERQLNGMRDELRQTGALLKLMDGIGIPEFKSATALAAAADEMEFHREALNRLDLTKVASLEAEKQSINEELEGLNGQKTDSNTLIGEYRRHINDQGDIAEKLINGMEAKKLQVEKDAQRLHRLCVENPGLSFNSFEQEIEELSATQKLTDHHIQQSINMFGNTARQAYGDIREEAAEYNQNANSNESIQGVHAEEKEGDFTPVYVVLVSIRNQVSEQISAQREIGLLKNVEELRRARESFKDVFTKQFCYEIRNAVDGGVKSLRAMNDQLCRLKFGTDRFTIDWSDWDPEFERYYRFFEAAYQLSESQESANLFESEGLSSESIEVRDRLTDLLLSDDQDRSMKELQRIADYRNYRRYEIWKESDSGSKMRLSSWGTGSGGQLETPSYIVRAAVVTNRLKHFERGTHLKMLASDESFKNMDERRAREIIRFLNSALGIQIICAMPTKNSGAIKPEFSKEWCFTRITAEENGEVNFVSEADDRDLKPDSLRALWEERRGLVREQARLEFESEHPVEATV